MKIEKIIYWIATAIMCLIFLYSAYMYFTNYDGVVGFFEQLGYPTYLIYPLAILKVLGVIAILTKLSPMLKEWAYAGFFFDAVLAWVAHYVAQDGQGMFAIIAIVTLIISRFLDWRTSTPTNEVVEAA